MSRDEGKKSARRANRCVRNGSVYDYNIFPPESLRFSAVRLFVLPYVRPLPIMQNRQKTPKRVGNSLWSYTDPLRTHLFARPGLFLEKMEKVKNLMPSKALGVREVRGHLSSTTMK